MGSVYIHADFTLDVDRLRAEHSRVLAGSDLWDGNVDVVQVVDTTERTMVLRTLVSAASSPKAWDLRCLVREALITWIRENQPEALPRERMRIHGAIRPARTS
jgi:aminoglycoside/choline kinase family phosphotransferase